MSIEFPWKNARFKLEAADSNSAYLISVTHKCCVRDTIRLPDNDTSNSIALKTRENPFNLYQRVE